MATRQVAPKLASFKWVKPEVYPLLAAVGAGVGCTLYSTWFNFTTNPDVRVNKTRRVDAASEDPEVAKQGQAYRKSLYRGIGSVGKV